MSSLLTMPIHGPFPQVASELKKMTAFIKQEALEKAREIQLKADEEFAIEKSKLVRSETSSIDSQYEKKFKQASMSQQITRSTMANKTRLKVLSARQGVLEELFEQTRGKVGDVSKRGDYGEIMTGLLLEGLYALNEPKVQVRVRKADKDVVKKSIEAAQKECKKNLGRETEVEIDEKDPLPDGSYVLKPLQGPLDRSLLIKETGPVECISSEVTAKSRSTTPSRSG